MKRLRHGEYVGGKESAEHSIWRTFEKGVAWHELQKRQ